MVRQGSRQKVYWLFFVQLFLWLHLSGATQVFAVTEKDKSLLRLTEQTERVDLYETLTILPDRNMEYAEEQILAGTYDEQFLPVAEVIKKRGFFQQRKWITFELTNDAADQEWLLEFAFPLIEQIHLYEIRDNQAEKIYLTGTDFPFDDRELNYRYFAFPLNIEEGERKKYYAYIHAGGDLHPPINIWQKDIFIENVQVEMLLLGLFYGVIIVMILYNLFLYLSLRIRAYLYYVLSITITLLAYMSLNGDAYKYLWPHFPGWNFNAVSFLVSIACIFIIIFTKEFLDTKKNIPKFTKISYGLMCLNGLTILFLTMNHWLALNMMIIASFITFVSVMIVGSLCLLRGVREARFFVIGWLVFLTGTFITMIQRATIIPASILTEYAGQVAFSIEVALLSLALADKIKRMRLEKEVAEKIARESQEMVIQNLRETDELKDEILAITSHELRTPLYGMIGIAESLRDGIAGALSKQASEQLEMIIKSGKRLSDLINDILNFSRLKNRKITFDLIPVQLQDVVNVVFSICQPLLKEKNIKLINQIPTDCPSVLAEPNRLQQILYNLIGNAIKYTTHGEVKVNAIAKGDKMQVYVSDTGRGIAVHMLEKIFEPFQQEESVYREDYQAGTGIGLNVTKRLVELHGGEITVHSKVHRGSVFTFTLQLSRAGLDLADQPERGDFTATHQGKKQFSPQVALENAPEVLVVDDERINLQVLTNQLTLEGIEVTQATTGQEAIDLIAKHKFDLVILDVMLPGMSGYDVSAKLRETYTLLELPILMLTSKSQLADKLAAFEVGANDYVTTPCDKEELLSRVKTLVNLKSLKDELSALNLILEEKVRERTVELEKLNIDLSYKNESLMKMEQSRKNLLANISHELGNPVTVIHGYIQAVNAGLIKADDKNYLRLLFDKVVLLNRLIDDLADLAHLEAGELRFTKENILLADWLAEIEMMYQIEVEKAGRQFKMITKHLGSSKAYYCLIDKNRMEQVFNNIIHNAIKHTDAISGKIMIISTINNPANQISFEIKDNGIGISPSDIPRLFERFFRGSKEKQRKVVNGTGLGLTIVKEIVDSHDGKAWVESEEGVGTSFHLTFTFLEEVKAANHLT